MKVFAIFFLSLLTFKAKAQNFCGHYSDRFGSELQIDPDSTFQYVWAFDNQKSWSVGKWKVINDTILFDVIPVFDTLKYTDPKNNIKLDSLILSRHKKPSQISIEEANSYAYHSTRQSSPISMSNKLFYRRGKLFGINKNGKLIKKKVRGFWSPKKFHQWYTRSEVSDWFFQL